MQGNLTEDQQEQILQKIIVMMQEEFGDDLQGILATGSRIYGAPGPTSDIDVHVVIAFHKRQRRNILLDGIEVEMFINPAFQILRYMDEGGHDRHMFTFGQALYDPQGVIADLQVKARTLWEAGPPPIPKTMEWLPRYGIADLARDLEDVQNDTASRNLLFVRIVEQLIDTHYRLHQRWPEKPKRCITDLERWDAVAAQLARVVLEDGSYRERRETLDQLAEHVTRPDWWGNAARVGYRVGGGTPIEIL